MSASMDADAGYGMNGTGVEPTLGGLSDIQKAWRILAAGAPQVATALVDIATNGQSEYARVTAAMGVLDRIGLGAQLEIGITSTQLLGTTPGEDGQPKAVDAVRARLRLLKTQALEMAAAGSEVIEGEVEESPGATIIALHPDNG